MSYTPESTGFDGLLRAMDRQSAREREYAAREAQYEAESRIERAHRAAFTAHCLPATLIEYTAWMIGWLRQGHEPSSVVDRSFTAPGMRLDGSLGGSAVGGLRVSEADPSWWTLAERPTNVPSLYGAHSLHVIVPEGVDFAPRDVPDTFHGRCGHSTFYFMDGFQIVGDFTPVYSDMLPVLANTL